MLVVTRHAALVTLLVERGIIPSDGRRLCATCGCSEGSHDAGGPCNTICYTHRNGERCVAYVPGTPYAPDDDVIVVEHANEDDVRGKHVVGVLPLRLAALAASVTEVPLNMAPEERGAELGIVRLREIAGAPVTYTVRLALA